MSAIKIVTPWHNPKQRDAFLAGWGVETPPDFLILLQDEDRSGCALTKNRGIRRAIDAGAEIVIVLDDDCFKSDEALTFEALIEKHVAALEPQDVTRFATVTTPPSRGTPYFNHMMRMPVAAAMGFWLNVGDYDAPAQLVHGAQHPMTFDRRVVFGEYFALSGMNLSFRTSWWPYCQFVNVPRMDDIWAGFIWQRRAYEMGHCFNLRAPLVTHSRQSNVFANLRDEAVNLEKNETLWSDIALSESTDYETLRGMIPVAREVISI